MMQTTPPARASAGWRDGLEAVLQVLLTTLRLFARNELQNHAAAVAFYFLLSAVPVVFLILWITGSLLQAPSLGETFVGLLAGIDARIGIDTLRDIGLLPGAGAGTAGVLSLLAMAWASRNLLDALQAAFRVIHSDAARRPAWVDWGISLLLIPGAIAAVVLLAVGRALLDWLAAIGGEGWSAVAGREGWLAAPGGDGWLAGSAPALAALAGDLLTLAIVWIAVVAAFSGLPSRRPPTGLTLRVALLCVLSFVALRVAFAQFVQLDHYQGVYASLGTLVFVLFWVFAVFLVLLFWAQCLYAAQHLDAIALEKLVLSAKGEHNWLDRRLFGRHSRLDRKYGRAFGQGETIVRQGDDSQVAFYLAGGRIGLFREAADGTRNRLASVEAGEIFGEMAWLLKERRSATAVAETEVAIYRIPPSLFEELLALNPKLARRVIETLSERLRQMSTRDG